MIFFHAFSYGNLLRGINNCLDAVRSRSVVQVRKRATVTLTNFLYEIINKLFNHKKTLFMILFQFLLTLIGMSNASKKNAHFTPHLEPVKKVQTKKLVWKIGDL
jgi:hypothetical protein